MAHFLRVVKKQEAPVCSLEDGIAALLLTEAVHRSAREGCLVKF
jgi:predicted dehydrogenase